MKIKRSLLIITAMSFIIFSIFSFDFGIVYANELNDSIDEQLGKIDFSELENFFDEIFNNEEIEFTTILTKLLKGESVGEFSSLGNYINNIILSDVLELLPTLISVIAISILCGIIQSSKGNVLSDNIAETTFFVCMIGLVLILSAELITIYNKIKITIENIAKLNEIMSPIMISLMIAVGGNVSASIYKPTTIFLSNIAINTIISVILPLTLMFCAFSVASNFSATIKLNKFMEFAASTIKWILGLIVSIFGLFVSVQGITSAHYDGISLKAAKYAISNSVPIIGGFLKDGFDLVIAGSVLIKNAIGVASILILLYIILSPVLYLAAFSLMLKLVGAIIEPVCDVRISNFCSAISKTATYLTVALLAVGFMFFLNVIIMIITANAFI